MKHSTAKGDGLSLKHVELGRLLDLYGSLLTEKQRHLLDLTVNADLSLAELAETQGTSRQAVHETVRRAEISLRRFEKQLGLLGKQQRMGALLSDMAQALAGSAPDQQKTGRCLALVAALEAELDSDERSRP